MGIYALEKADYAELCNINCSSTTELKRKVREFRKSGYKVLYNGKDK